MKGILVMLFGQRQEQRQAVQKQEFVELHQHASDSVEAQDAYHGYLFEQGLMCSNVYLPDELAQAKLDAILALPTSGVEKDALLSALDVAVQNNHPAGIGAEVINQIHAAQYAVLVDDEWREMCKGGG
jgi:hypothetical protein